ncbi:MAG: CoA transferase [Chloroflexi bacterium]|nr:CoA transferase [Chloroflexota bacterium]
MSKPLEGIKVVELAQAMAGPYAGMFLADYGADVVKVEPPDGELWRRFANTPPDSKLRAARMSPAFVVMNRNKRSVVLDLKLEEGRQVLRRLVAVSDVLIENLRPGEAENLGMGYDTARELNPRIVYASISGFGHRGPEASSRAFDPLAQARAGILSARRYPDGTPVSPSVFVADLSCATMVAYAVTLALLDRAKSGLGQKIEASLLGAAIGMNLTPLVQVSGEEPVRPKLAPLNCPYRGVDGRFLFLSDPAGAYFGDTCKALGIPQVATEDAFSTQASRERNAEALHSVLEDVLRARPAREWLALLQERGVPCTLVLEPAEVFSDPQVRANSLMVEQVHPVLGKVRMPGLSFRLCGTEGDVRRGAPALGEHTASVLKELGYDDAAILGLEEQGVTRIAP